MKHWSRTALIVVSALTVAGALTLLTLAAPAAPARVAPGRRLLWHDGFTGRADAPPDPRRWRIDNGGHESGDQETYRDLPATIGLTGYGQLRITAIHTNSGYLSARVTSLPHTFLPPPHGTLRVSARIQTAPGAGVGTSFWTWGTDVASWPANGEIDIAENLGREPDRVHTAIQCPTCHETKPPYGLGTVYTNPRHHPYNSGYHTFTADWQRDPDAISWYIDGRRVAHRTPADTGASGWVFDQPMFLLLAVRVGGPFIGAPNARAFPATALIDDVSVHTAYPSRPNS